MGAARLAETANPSAASTARAYAQRLLDDLGIRAQPRIADEHPALSWARSGLMSLTGSADGAGLMCPAPLAACADGAFAALAALAPPGVHPDLRGSQLLGERAALLGLSRAGPVAPGGACRLLEAADGWMAVNLARAEDWDLLPAWTEGAATSDWPSLAAILRGRGVAEWVERARWLGLAVAAERARVDTAPRWFERKQKGSEGRSERMRRSPRVVDLSSLWAGPLCAQLLQGLGAEVIKVESLHRPDGARQGSQAFFDLLNSGKRSVALDLHGSADVEMLRVLLRSADIVIEGSRPRALHQLGVYAESLIKEKPSLTWISLTGYGRGLPQENWIAYGDDAGVAAGLAQLMHEASGQRVFVGDAIADPLSGLHAALAAWAGWLQGGGGLTSIALSEVVRYALCFDRAEGEVLLARQRAWTQRLRDANVEAAGPRARSARGTAAVLGADNAAVLGALSLSGPSPGWIAPSS
jgi:hypothetical protein